MLASPPAEKPLTLVYVLAGYGSLLLCSYFDNIRGPLLPAVASDLGLEFSQSGWFLALGYAVATVVTFALISTLNRYSERRVMLVLCALGLATAATAPLVGSYAALLLLAALVGGTISMMGTMANVLVIEGTPESRQGRLLSGLHAMFGIGSALASAAVGWALRRGFHWSALYAAAAPVFIAYAVLAFRRMGDAPAGGGRAPQSAAITGRQAFAILLFSVYVAGEVTTAIWLVTYLVQFAGLANDDATRYLTAYFVVLTVARIACSIFLRRAHERPVLLFALAAPIAAFGAGYAGVLWAFALMGLYGPFFPVFLARVSRTFPDKWRAVTVWTIVGMNVTIGIGQIALGKVADALGMRAAFLIPPVLLLAALALLGVWFLWEARTRAADQATA